MIATLLTIVFLIAMWVAVLAAPVLQNRGSSNKGGDSIKTFQRQLATLERATPYRSAAPRSEGRSRNTPLAGPVGRRPLTSAQLAAQRRRNTLLVLAGTALASLVGTLTMGGWFLAVHLVADALLVTFVVLMLRTVRMAAEREMKVAFLPHRESGAEPTALLRDVARSRRG
ncbi:MAG: hypothetical protein QOJ19_2527 [Acidimicrobiia bacterium]|nr:hypothetical protein [Acidimicrobiia bacterium]